MMTFLLKPLLMIRYLHLAPANIQIWGIGLAPNDPRVQNPAAWDGSNLLGKCLMKVRAALRA